MIEILSDRGWTLEFSKVGKSKKGGAAPLNLPSNLPSSSFSFFPRFVYTNTYDSRDLFALVYPFIVSAILFILFSREIRNDFEISTSVLLVYRAEARSRNENHRRKRIALDSLLPTSSFPLRRKKNRGCVRRYIPAFRPMCFHAVNNNGESSAERERTSMPLLVYPLDKLHPRVLLFFFLLLASRPFSFLQPLSPSFRRVSTSIPQLFLTSPLLINISRAAYHRLLANCDTSSRGSQSAWSSK